MTFNENKKTIVILTPAFPADESETAWVRPKQLFVKKIRENFPSIPVIVLSFNYPHHTNEYAWRGVRIIPFNGMYTRKIQRILLWIRVWRRLRKIKKAQPIMGIFSLWCGECALVGKHFANFYGINHFIWISGMDAKKENKLVKWIRPEPKELIAMSYFLAKEFYKNHSIKPQHTLPIGIDPREFSPFTGKKDIDILGVGSLSPFKQYDVFIQIVKEMSRTFPAIKAMICGDGSDRLKLDKMIKDLRLENNITITGYIQHPEVLQLMQRAKVFIHPSSYEGFGAVCLEALYAGALVISLCDPMQLTIDRWYIAKDADDMRKKTWEILSNDTTSHESVLLYSMDDTAKAVMNLFADDKST
jgi:glycosyltransferase involved in cell wall biosynthesis